MNKIFCEKLKELRLEKNLRQFDLAKIFNVAPNTISSWERGNSAPSIDELKVIAKFFGVSTDYLLGLED
ncbi:MAG: helix-turn-helix domain-containing protein [Firmicutes bacterium]|nr:helix-turn-helix domain-containing protein [Bacillota bacterium]